MSEYAAHAFVATQRPSFRAGTQVKGRVVLHVADATQLAVRLQSVNAQLVCRICATVPGGHRLSISGGVPGTGGRKDASEASKREESAEDRSWVAIEQSITVWNDAESAPLSNGTHILPFSFETTAEHPGSLNLGRLPGSSASLTVETSIAAICSYKGNNSGPNSSDVSDDQLIDCRQVSVVCLPAIPVEGLIQGIDVHAAKSFVFDQGSARLRLTSPRSVAVSSTSLPICISVDNSTKRRFDGISVQLIRHIDVTSKEGRSKSSNEVVFNARLPHSAVPPRTKSSTPLALPIPSLAIPTTKVDKANGAIYLLRLAMHSKLSSALHVTAPIHVLSPHASDPKGLLPLAGEAFPPCAQELFQGASAHQIEWELPDLDVNEGLFLIESSFSAPNRNPRKAGNEDRVHVEVDPSGPFALACVCDGHGGEDAAEFVIKALPNAVKEALGGLDEDCDDAAITTALEDAFLEVDKRLLLETYASSGSCCALAVLWRDRLLFADCGDCRALAGGSDSSPVCFTEDHKPSLPREKQRVEQSGGMILQNRVYGMLAVTRAFGDREFKKSADELVGANGSSGKTDAENGPDERVCSYTTNPRTALTALTALPDVTIKTMDELGLGSTAWLLVGCDGVFDFVDSGEIGGYVDSQIKNLTKQRSVFHRSCFDSQKIGEICENLVFKCGELGNFHDDITCGLIVIDRPGQVADDVHSVLTEASTPSASAAAGSGALSDAELI